MFYLTTHSVHFIYGYMVSDMVTFSSRKEMFYLTTLSTFYLRLYGIRHMVTFSSRNELNVLFNNTLRTFYLRLYGVRHMVTFTSLQISLLLTERINQSGSKFAFLLFMLAIIMGLNSFNCRISATLFNTGVLSINTFHYSCPLFLFLNKESTSRR